MKKLKNNNDLGITLVALVVTIVVLLILAGISLSLILGQNGIIKKATDGKTNYSVAQGEEENTLNNASDWIDKNTGKPKVNPLPHNDTTTPYLPTGCTQVADTDLDNGLTIKDSKENEYVWVEVPKNEEVYQTAGLSVTTFSDDNYTKIENDLKNYTKEFRKNYFSDTWNSKQQFELDESTYYNLKKEMLKSLYQNGGFWVGKYEVGDSISTANNTTRSDTTGFSNEPVIKKGQQPYNYIESKNAVKLAKKFNPDSSKYNTDLMFGVQWDLILKYLESKNALNTVSISDSTEFGNFTNSKINITNGMYNELSTIENGDYRLGTWKNTAPLYSKIENKKVLFTTGATERNCKQNIYDLAGNIRELTFEVADYNNGTSDYAVRGGSFIDTGSTDSITSRISTGYQSIYYFIGFRTCLYKK